MKINIRSTRFRVYFTLFLAIIIIPLLLNYSLSQSNLPDTAVFIPQDHQTKRFDYLEIENLVHVWSPENLQITGTLKNTSLIYNLTDIQLEINLYGDEEATEYLLTYDHEIASIGAGAEYDLLLNLERNSDVESWRMIVKNLSLEQK